MTGPENTADIEVQQEEPPKAQAEPVAEAQAEPVAEAPPSPDATATATATGTVAATGRAADVQSQATVAEAEAAATTTTTTTDAKDAPQAPQAPSPQTPSQAISSSDEDVRPEPEPFVNNGLKKWQTAREEWCRKRKSSDPDTAQDDPNTSSRPKAASAIPIDVDGVIDVLFDPRWRGGSVVAGQRAKVSLQPPRFPTNVPLPQMIDVLTDLWEAEGLDV